MALDTVHELLARARRRAAQGDHPGALADARQAAALDPVDADAHLLVGLSRLLLGDPGGTADLDRAEALFAAAGDRHGRWEVRQARRLARSLHPPWLWLEPHPAAPPDPTAARVPVRTGGRSGPVVRVRLGLVVVGVRWATVVVVLAVATPVLPGLSVGGTPPVAALGVLVVAAGYRMLHAGTVAGLRSLVPVLPGRVVVRVGRLLHAGPWPVVVAVRWAAATVTAAGLFAVAGWLADGIGVRYAVAGPDAALVVGAVLGLGTFVRFPVLRAGTAGPR